MPSLLRALAGLVGFGPVRLARRWDATRRSPSWENATSPRWLAGGSDRSCLRGRGREGGGPVHADRRIASRNLPHQALPYTGLGPFGAILGRHTNAPGLGLRLGAVSLKRGDTPPVVDNCPPREKTRDPL